MSVSEPEFRRALSDFVLKVDQLGKTDRWTLHKMPPRLKQCLAADGVQTLHESWRHLSAARLIATETDYTRNKPCDLGICAKQSVMIKWRGEAINRQVHVTYNPTYRVPVLWFNFYRRDGSPLSSSEVMGMSNNGESSANIAQYISLNEHPLLGVLFYNIHPCKTKDIMNELSGKGNYIAKWLSVYGAPIGIAPPDALFTSKAFSQRSEDASQSSDDGSQSTLEM